jgi:PAS domain S-box-containing protein
MLQVKMAMGFENFNDVAIPNTVQTCQKQYDYPMVMTLADRPYTIVQVNERWENLTGYTGAEVVGKRSCSILQGPDTGREDLEHLMSPLLFKRPSCGMLTNYTKNRRRYRSYITLYPLSTDSTVSHYFGLTTFVQWIDPEETAQSQERSSSSGVSQSGGSSGSTSGQSKRPRDESTGGSSAGSRESKHAKTNVNNLSSCSDGTNTNEAAAAAAVKLVTASNREKQSLSSLTSSMSSSSTTVKEGGNVSEGDQQDSNSVAVLAPTPTKAPTLTSGPKVEFSEPLATLVE